MEPENLNQETSQVEQTSSLHQMTPLSKYLAMVLFVVMPFVGGYVGYTFAPVKVVEVEKIIQVEKEIEKVVYIEKEESSELISSVDTEGWELYQNDYYTLKHPDGCRMNDYLEIGSNNRLLDKYVSFIGVCDAGPESMGIVRVTRDSVEQIIDSERQIASRPGSNRTLLSVDSIEIGEYEAQKMTFRNETGQFESSTVIFSENGLSFILSGITTDESLTEWNIEGIFSTIKVL